VRELALAARQYALATAGQPQDHDALYNHGLVLQELSGRLQAGSAEQAAMLRQVGGSEQRGSFGRSAACCGRPTVEQALVRTRRNSLVTGRRSRRHRRCLPVRVPADSPPPSPAPQHTQACGRYEAALQLRPSSHAALYNWGVALSDLARCVKQREPAAATAALHLASQKYAAALQLHPRNPQALNNWGLVLQELSSDAAADAPARDRLVRAAMDKFRLTLRSRPDFDRGCYNLGTVFYTHALALQGNEGVRRARVAAPWGDRRCCAQPRADRGAAGRCSHASCGPPPHNTPPPHPCVCVVPAGGAGGRASRQARDLSVRTLLAVAAQYICLAHALQPSRDIYRKSLAVVRQMLPLPFLRAGYLTLPRARSIGGVTEAHVREWCVLDHRSLRQASGVEASLSTASAGVLSGQQQRGAAAAAAAAAAAGAAGSGGAGGGAAAGAGDDDPLVLPLSELLAVRRCADPSLPEGAGIWVSTQARPTVSGGGGSSSAPRLVARTLQPSRCCVCRSAACRVRVESTALTCACARAHAGRVPRRGRRGGR
jgi:hypothetical protein